MKPIYLVYNATAKVRFSKARQAAMGRLEPLGRRSLIGQFQTVVLTSQFFVGKLPLTRNAQANQIRGLLGRWRVGADYELRLLFGESATFAVELKPGEPPRQEAAVASQKLAIGQRVWVAQSAPKGRPSAASLRFLPTVPASS